MSAVVKKKQLNVSASCLTPLLRGIVPNLNVTCYNCETEKTKFVVDYHNYDFDIEGKYSLFHKDPFEVSGEKHEKYKLVIKQQIGFKSGGDEIVKDKIKDKKYIFSIPTVWFRFDLLEKPFSENVKVLNELYQQMPHKEDVELNKNGEPVLVLRPGNLTHSVLAFRVEYPELFRQSLFEIIVDELSKLWKARREFKYIDNYQKAVEENIKNCGLKVISKNTFGLEGGYSYKMDSFEPAGWGLSLFIKGKDTRTVKYGDKVFIHDDWHHVKTKGQSIIHPIDVYDLIGGDQKGDEFKDMMDNEATPICGSIDYRKVNMAQRFYFVETSPNFSSEYYTDEFAANGIKHTLARLEELHEEYIGNKNDDLKERREKYFEECKAKENTVEIENPLDGCNYENCKDVNLNGSILTQEPEDYN